MFCDNMISHTKFSILVIILNVSVNSGYNVNPSTAENDEYEIVKIRPVTRKVAGHGGYPSRYAFNAFGNTYHIRLNEAKNVISNYAGYGLPVRIIDDTKTRDIMVDLVKEGIRFFQDEENNGAFAVKLVNGSNHDDYAFDGILTSTDHDIVIEPLQRDTILKRDVDDHIQHVVYKRMHSTNNNGRDDVVHSKREGVGYMYNTFNAGSFSGSFNTESLTGAQQSPFFTMPLKSPFIRPQSMVGEIYKHLSKSASFRTQANRVVGPVSATVEILAWTDLSFLRSFETILRLRKNDLELAILKYIATVVNAANLRYKRGIQDPSLNVSLVLSGAVICKTANCSTFTEGNKVQNTVNNYVALDEFAETLEKAYKESRFIFIYDYAVAFTRLDIIDTHGTPIGVSFTDKICSIADGKSSSVIEDQGGYSSVGTLVHELAHTLGSDHDGWFRGINCRPSDGYTMSSLSPLTKNGFYFSQCSIDSIKKNLIKTNASCVHDQPHIHHLYTSLVTDLPGQIFNRTEQCRQIYGTHFCLSVGTTLKDICYKMYCWDPTLPNVCSTKTPAALGTSCGPNRWCVSGECVYDPKAP